MFAQVGLGILALVVLFVVGVVLVALRDDARKRTSQRLAREAAVRRRVQHEEELRRDREALSALPRKPVPDRRRPDPELILDHVLREFRRKPKDSSSIDMVMRTPEWARLEPSEIRHAWNRAVSEGLALYDDNAQRWRLTRRGHRIFEEFAGDRKRMDEAEQKRNQPSVTIDARGAGNVAHTVHGDMLGGTVNNATSGRSTSAEVDLPTVLALLEQVRAALADAEGLSGHARTRALADLDEVDRELRVPGEEREPGRIQTALERLRTTFVGVEGLLEAVNRIWDHLRAWLPG
ncbi:hypothetical protein [Streptomyces xiaopingdaonensis]|uniref:hypothetical protein n=1 Tax=Streptomyces xiaopingdaonensis TaxID=1565415 RepID=UPI000378C50C|nr:hypothetical protein [Streptomyces xiaopingdaonensis]